MTTIQSTRAGRMLAVASGKGGVGKTWFAISLAHVLAQQGRRVLLFDGDLGLANIDVQLGLTPALDLSAVVAGRSTVQGAAVAYPPGGFDVLAGRSGSGALAALDPAALERVLSALRAADGYDHVVLDLGAGLDRSTRRMAAWSDTLLVIATEEPTSLTDAYAVMKLHAADQPQGDARFIVNLAGSPASGARTFATLARACTAFLGRTPPLAGVIRRDDRDAMRFGGKRCCKRAIQGRPLPWMSSGLPERCSDDAVASALRWRVPLPYSCRHYGRRAA